MRSITNVSAAILKNPEVIAVDQDPLMRSGRRVSNRNGQQVWRKDLADGSVAVALFNSGEEAARIPVVFEEVGFTGCDRVAVRDLLARKDLGVRVGVTSQAIQKIYDRTFVSEIACLRFQGLDGAVESPLVPAHGSAMLNLSIVW